MKAGLTTEVVDLGAAAERERSRSMLTASRGLKKEEQESTVSLLEKRRA